MATLEQRLKALEVAGGIDSKEFVIIVREFGWTDPDRMWLGERVVYREPGEDRRAFHDRAIPLLRNIAQTTGVLKGWGGSTLGLVLHEHADD